MICTCEKCRRNFFPGDPPISCPECGGEVVSRQGWSELHYLVDLLARGEIRESLAVYVNTQPEKAPELMDVVERINALLDSIPRETSDRYFMELNHLKGLLLDYYNDRYYEVLHRRGVPKIEAIGKKLWMGLVSLEQKLSRNAPGAGEKLMPWAYEEPRGSTKYKEWIPGIQAAFQHFMPPIPTPYPKVYFSNASSFHATRENILKEVGCPLQGLPEDSSLEYIHGDKGGAILIRLDQLPKEITFGHFAHFFWHELGHFYAINADPYNLERFDDPDNPPAEANVETKQRGYWFWQEFIAEAICNHVSWKVDCDQPDYHPEKIDWVVDTWSPILSRLQGFLEEMFYRPGIDDYCLAHYFATLLMDDMTVRMVKAGEEGKLKRAGKDTPAPPGAIDATCIDELDKEMQPIMLEMKAWLEKQMGKDRFWIIDEAGIEYLGELILRMADVFERLSEE